MGASGFIGKYFCEILNLNNINFLGYGSKEINLLDKDKLSNLTEIIKNGDNLVYLSSISPTKDYQTLLKNNIMTSNLIEILSNIKLNHFILISSDAIYGDKSGLYSEESPYYPDNYHGLMHITREMICNNLNAELASTIRPTNVYGFGDPHNSYGINRFIRTALKDKSISLFGNGLSKRDHIFVEDVARIIFKVLKSNEAKVLNAITGQSLTFHEIAEYIKFKLNNKIKILTIGQESVISYKKYDNDKVFQLLDSKLPIDYKKGIDIYLNKLKLLV